MWINKISTTYIISRPIIHYLCLRSLYLPSWRRKYPNQHWYSPNDVGATQYPSRINRICHRIKRLPRIFQQMPRIPEYSTTNTAAPWNIVNLWGFRTGFADPLGKSEILAPGLIQCASWKHWTFDQLKKWLPVFMVVWLVHPFLLK